MDRDWLTSRVGMENQVFPFACATFEMPHVELELLEAGRLLERFELGVSQESIALEMIFKGVGIPETT